MQPGTPERLNLYFTNVVRTSKVEGSLDDFKEVFEELCSKEVVWTGTGGRKYEPLDLDLGKDGKKALKRVLSKVLALRYWHDELTGKRKWVRLIVDEDGKLDPMPRPANMVLFHSADLLWLYPRLLVVRGSETDADTAFHRFKRRLKSRISLKRQAFDPYFLFWIWRKWSTGKKTRDAVSPVRIGMDLKVRRIRGAVVLGISDLTGRKISIDDMETQESLALLQTLLSGRGILELRATFQVKTGDILFARIFSNGTVRVKIAESLGSGDPQAKKFALSIILIDQLVKAFDEWRKLPKREREPTEKVYRQIKLTFEKRWAKYSQEDAKIRKAQRARQSRRRRS